MVKGRFMLPFAVVYVVCLSALLRADEPENAKIIFANAASMPGRAFIEVNGQDVNSSGLVGGRSTGWVGLPPNAIKVVIDHDPLGKAEAEVELQAAGRSLIFVYMGMGPGRKPERPEVRAAKIEVIDCKKLGFNSSDKYQLALLSVSLQPTVDVVIGSENVVLRRFEPLIHPLKKSGTFLPISVPVSTEETVQAENTKGPEVDAKINSTAQVPLRELVALNLEDHGKRMVIIYDTDKPGELAAISLSSWSD